MLPVINEASVLFCMESKFGDEITSSISEGYMLINLLLFYIRGLLMLTSEHWYQMKFFKQSLSGNLVIFGVVLFPNVDGLVDLAAINAFLAYHHSKESPVVAILAYLFDTFDRRCEKNSAQIVCCLLALCVWLVSHLFQQDTRHLCPLQSYRSCAELDTQGNIK